MLHGIQKLSIKAYQTNTEQLLEWFTQLWNGFEIKLTPLFEGRLPMEVR